MTWSLFNPLPGLVGEVSELSTAQKLQLLQHALTRLEIASEPVPGALMVKKQIEKSLRRSDFRYQQQDPDTPCIAIYAHIDPPKPPQLIGSPMAVPWSVWDM